MPTETSPTQTQTWLTALTAIAGTLGAVLAKKRFSRKSNSVPKSALDSLTAKLEANHKEVLAAVAAQGTAVEKRLDALEAAVARLDERTRIQSSSSSSSSS
jgi:hypothetical protein